MRQRRLWIILTLALSSGGLAAYLALAYLREQTPRLMAAQPPARKVAVAARALPVGVRLRAEDVRLVDWPQEAVLPGYAGSVEALVGRGVIVPVGVNEPLLDTKLARKEAGGGLAIAIPEGMRGVSVRVDEVIGVAGFVLPGTRVDVLVTLPPRTGRTETVTQIVLQNIPVLAAGQQTQQDAQGKPVTVAVITLLVSPEQGERLILAASDGKVQLALRNTLDLAEVPTGGIRSDALLARPATKAENESKNKNAARRSAPVDAATVVEAYRGGVRTLIKF